MATQPIQIKGYAEFRRALRQIDSDLPKMWRDATREAAAPLVARMQRRVPVLTGRAQRSYRFVSSGGVMKIMAGGVKVPYIRFLEFGGTTGRGHERGKNLGSVKRQWLKGGRYLWATFAEAAVRGEFNTALNAAFARVARQAGMPVEMRHG